MGFDFSGFVLRAPRTAPSNFTTTDEAVNGVCRDWKPLSDDYRLASPTVVEIAADQYRAAVLLRPQDGETQYLVWAANTANLRDLVAPSVSAASAGSIGYGDGTLVIPNGEPDEEVILSSNASGSVVLNTVTGTTFFRPAAQQTAQEAAAQATQLALVQLNEDEDPDPPDFTDGTTRVLVVDAADRNIDTIIVIEVRRGDTGETITLDPNTQSGVWNSTTGAFTITSQEVLDSLNGGLSRDRGDTVVSVEYTVSGPKFWWSKNDPYANRFTWDGAIQAWRPFRGTGIRDLGRLLPDTSYTLSPAPSQFNVDEFLPGDSSNGDSYSMVRIGARPDAASIPVAQPPVVDGFGGIKVLFDADVANFNFALEPEVAAVVGQTSGELVWNPEFITAFAGQSIFYSYESFIDQTEIEAVGFLAPAETSPLFISPIPEPTEYPFIRIDNRSPLSAVGVDTEEQLLVLNIESGQVGYARSTGRLRFSSVDVDKAKPDSDTFDKNFLNARVYYDGVSLSQEAIPLRDPVQLVNGGGDPVKVAGKRQPLYVPDAKPTPGFGVSGVMHIPDATGKPPTGEGEAGVRPGVGPSGLLRSINGSWDSLIFNQKGEQLTRIRVVDDPDEIPVFRFRIPRGTAYLNLNKGAGGSEVTLGRKDLQRFSGDSLYFLQASVQPSVYAPDARIYSRVQRTWTLTGTEKFTFSIDGEVSVWDASLDPGGINTSEGGDFTAEQIATSLQAVTSGVVGFDYKRLYLATSTLTTNGYVGSIEIGFGPDGERDLSGCAALGFLPGWLVRFSDNATNLPDLHWLPDNGVHLGVYRSPFNRSGSKDDIADIRHIGRYRDIVFSSGITASPIVLFDRAPIQNIAGLDDNVFFEIQIGLKRTTLRNFEQLYYELAEKRVTWINRHNEIQTIEQPSLTLNFDRTRVLVPSLFCPNNGLRLSVDGGLLEKQTFQSDYLMLQEGQPGLASLIDVFGERKAVGSKGEASGTTFRDTSPEVNFIDLGVAEGWQLDITIGDLQGTYVVTGDPIDANTLSVSPPFATTGETLSWELYEGLSTEVNDLGIVADHQYISFQHLTPDPWQIRVLSNLGAMPASASAQSDNRLVAEVGDALLKDRDVKLRFGREFGSPSALVTYLKKVTLGTVPIVGLTVPSSSDVRFTTNAFSIQVGGGFYTFADETLIKVSEFTEDLTGDVIEVLDTTGELNFGSTIVNDRDGQDILFVEIFLPAQDVASGQSEIDPLSGEVNISELDIVEWSDRDVFFVEEINTLNPEEQITLNPVQGSFFFNSPLRARQLVETHYFQAQNGTGDLLEVPVDEDNPDAGTTTVEVTEQLPFFVRLEVLTPEDPDADTNDKWFFNPTQRSVDTRVEPALYVQSTLYNVGSSPVATFEIINDTKTYVVKMKEPIATDSEVLLTYAVFETFGGEQAFDVSTPPVYRPPFKIESDTDTFVLGTDRRSDMIPGRLLRVESFSFYITESTYDPGTNETTVTFIPPTQFEAGSRDPGLPSQSFYTDRPIATAISEDAEEGFWVGIDAPYAPVNRGFQEIIFQGDVTAIARAEHILEIGGLPSIITASVLIDEGTRTQVFLAAPFTRGFAFEQDPARVSLRPVYPPLPEEFAGTSPIIGERPYEVILFGETDENGNALPGRELLENVDYEIDLGTGNIKLLNPPQSPLQPNQTLYLRHTRQTILVPVVSNQVIFKPRFNALFQYVEEPSEENNRLGAILRGTFTYSNPDTWFYRTLPLIDQLAEVSQDIAQDLAARLPSLGPSAAILPPPNNANQGTLGLRAQLSDLGDVDRAARVFLDFYNQFILPFEQIQEAISGLFIGDRDGKFQFFVGRDKELPPPGYEDPITGRLNRRNLFSEIFFAYNPSFVFLRRDSLVEPDRARLDVDKVIGPLLDPDFADDLADQQRDLAMNDIDDVVLFAKGRIKLRLFPLRFERIGRYRRLSQPHRFSRLFPTRIRYFTLTDPGLLSDTEADPVKPGVYAFRKVVERPSIKAERTGFLSASIKIKRAKRASTFFKSIADVGNPVFGQVDNFSSASVQKRRARGRVFLYSPTGFPELDSAEIPLGPDGNPLFDATDFSTNPRPAAIVSLLPLDQFPLGNDGLPDLEQLATFGGETIDLSTGDPDLFTPAWQKSNGAAFDYQQITVGRPDGRITDISTNDVVFFDFPIIGGAPSQTFNFAKRVYVGNIFYGCIITFEDEDGNEILSGNNLRELNPETGLPGEVVSIQKGDTLFVTPPEASVSAPADIDDPSTNSETAAKVQGLPSYRARFDVGLDRKGGDLRDITFPSFTDPSILGLKEILGQNPPKPLDELEGTVRFTNGRTDPLIIPALTGGTTNDDGDYTLPYLYRPYSELEVLAEVLGDFQRLFGDTGTLPPSAAYPDEIQGVDGAIANGVLTTALDATPVATAGSYTPNSGIGDVESFDVFLMQTDQGSTGIPDGSMGILSVGRVTGGATGSTIEPPRFVTPTMLGDEIRWNIRTAMSFVNQDIAEIPPGMLIRQLAGPTRTEFDITQISAGFVVFNDGQAAVVSGGLNNFIALGSGNVITINLWTAASLALPVTTAVDSITLDFGTNTATSAFAPGGVAITAASTDDNILTVTTAAPLVNVSNAGPPDLPEDLTNPGDTIPLWFTVDVNCSAGISTTGRIEEDRLTFSEALDIRSMLPRDEPDVAGIPVFSELSVVEVETDTTVNCTVNNDAECNGGVPFTFVRRSSSFPPTGATFNTAAIGGDGRGSVRVVAFEGHSNTPITSTSDTTFSAIPSSLEAEESADPIATGTGNAGTGFLTNNRISDAPPNALALTAGALSNIVSGDVVQILGSATGKASTKTGTYLIKHAIASLDPVITPEKRELVLETDTRSLRPNGWAQISFPRLVEVDTDNNQLTLENTTLSSGLSAWPTTGTLYLLTRTSQADPDYQTLNYRLDYLALNTANNTFTLDLSTLEDFSGTSVPIQTLSTILDEGNPVFAAGFNRFDIDMSQVQQQANGLPESLPKNTVGYNSEDPVGNPGGTTVGGFSGIVVTNEDGLSNVPFTKGAGTLVRGAPGANEIGIFIHTPVSSTSFTNDEDAIVYDGVAEYAEVDLAILGTLHATLEAILPGDAFYTSPVFPLLAGVVGFEAQTGIFLEPSWPVPTLDYAGGAQRIVDAGHSSAAANIGFRDGTLFGEAADEGTTWQVKRIRRFHEQLEAIGEKLGPLRYIYQTRRGVVDAYGEGTVGPDATTYPYVVTSNGGTNLGAFNDDLVNVNPGDFFRLLDAEGNVLDQAEVGGIDSDSVIWLREPGLTLVNAADVAGSNFEIYLRKPIVPHEQSNDQLLELLTDQVLLDRRSNFTTQDGGYVPVQQNPTDPRKLQDSDPTVNYVNLGIEAGDIIIIDPAGELAGPTGIPGGVSETGSRPFGDQSVPNRTAATPGQAVPFIAGTPSEFDDNRGFYRITEVTPSTLTVSSETEFSSDVGGEFVTFGVDAEYAVLPTVSASTAPFASPPGGPGVEGQMDLRPTSYAGENGSPTNSFADNLFSIAPISYRVIRPTQLLSEEGANLILFMRERIFSWLEEFDVWFQEDKYGSYFVFQRDEHAADLGNPLIPSLGKGVISNELVDNTRGLVGISPFANVSDCLSVLDRRYWVSDERLDREFPLGSGPGVPSYSTFETNENNPVADVGDGRPGLRDRISEVLDTDDELREQRFAWIDFRANREDGSIIQEERFEDELPKKRKRELRQIRLTQSIDETS